MPSVPHLDLTYGQVAWALCHGQAPDRRTLDAMRYLRQLGVPLSAEEQGSGSGNRLSYSFDQLIEIAAALYAVRRGIKPRHAAAALVADRAAFRKLCRSQFKACPLAALEAPWVKSAGKILPTMADERFLRLHERSQTTAGRIESMSLEEVLGYQAGLGDQVERYGQTVYVLVPIRRVMLEAVAWALVAPVTPPGRKSKKAVAPAT